MAAAVVKVTLVFTERKTRIGRVKRMWEMGSSQSGMVPTGLYCIVSERYQWTPHRAIYWTGFPELVTAMVNTGSCQVNNINNVGCYSLSYNNQFHLPLILSLYSLFDTCQILITSMRSGSTPEYCITHSDALSLAIS